MRYDQHQHADNVKVLPGWWHGGCLSLSPPQGEMALAVETIGIHPLPGIFVRIVQYTSIHAYQCSYLGMHVCTYKCMLLQMVDLSRYTFMFVLKTQLAIGIYADVYLLTMHLCISWLAF